LEWRREGEVKEGGGEGEGKGRGESVDRVGGGEAEGSM